MKLVTTNEFWKYMQKMAFRRTGRLTGQYAGELIVVLEPPEDTDIIDKSINETLKLLGR